MRQIASAITLAASLVLQVGLSFFVLLYLAENRCGGQGYPAPVEGSARASYCENFVEATNQSLNVLSLNVLYYWPIPFLLVGGIWAITRDNRRLLGGVILVAFLWPLVYMLPGVLLSGE